MNSTVPEGAAERRWAALLANDPVEAARVELRAGGVSAAIVETLYPYDFDALVPAVCEHAAAWRTPELTAMGDESWWAGLSPSNIAVASTFEFVTRDRWLEEGSGSDTPHYLMLEEVYGQRLAEVSSARVRQRAALMAERLWDACWFMSRINTSNDPISVREYFMEITDRLLPDLP